MKKVLIIILGILLVGTGMSLIVKPIEAFAMLGYIMGAVLLVNGIANVIIWFQTRKVQKISAWYQHDVLWYRPYNSCNSCVNRISMFAYASRDTGLPLYHTNN